MDIKWTTDQQNVINSRNCNLLVSAAAGSGKTAVLVERIINLILDKEKNIDINRLLVVTFTKAAAFEMKERIKKRIEDELEKDQKNTHLQKQILLLNEAKITTIDAFCKSVVSSNAHLLEYDESFRVFDEVENEILKNEIIDELFLDLYDKEDEDFLKLVSCYSSKRLDDQLKSIILSINDFSNQISFPKKWLFDKCEFFNPLNKNDEFYIKNYILDIFTFSKEKFEFIIKSIENELQQIQQFKELGVFIENNIDYINKLKTLNKDINEFLNHLDTESFNKIRQNILNFSNDEGKSFRIPKNTDPLIKENYKIIKDNINKLKEDVKDELLKMNINIEDIKKEHENIYPFMKSFLKITMLFKEKYQKKKKELNVADFSDIEHLALQLLMTEDENKEIKSSDIAKGYIEKYDEIFIDEYQDSNEIQEYILSLISKGNNRFMVGDVKQSIYRFRQADPSIFMEKYDTYINYNTQEKSLFKKILLFENFRSRKEILDGTNHIFSKIMKKSTAELEYTKEERLNPKAIFEPLQNNGEYAGGNVEIHLIKEKESLLDQTNDENIKGFKLESIEIANNIYKMINNKNFKIFDKDIKEYRNLKYKDIVILMRSPNTNSKILEETFLEYNIPFYSQTNGGYFQTFEISTIVNLLKIIDNPIQDIPFVATLRSPIYNFTTNELAKIRLVDKSLDFYTLLNKIIEDKDLTFDDKLKEKIKKFLNDLKLFSKKSILMTTDELLWFIFKYTGYLDYVGFLELGQIRKNNLLLLFEKAKEYESSSYKGLFNFINYIEKLQKNNKMSNSQSISEQEDVVRLMSIHKSKGLEFPVVILANTNNKFNFRETNNKLTMHKKFGFGIVIDDFEKNISFTSSMKRKIEKNLKKEQIAEEMRLLYVAMTRAKEKLIITGRIKDKEIRKNTQITDYEILNAKNFLEWILISINNLEEKEEEHYLANGIKVKILTNNEGAKFSLNIKTKEECLLEMNEIKNEKQTNQNPLTEIKKQKTKFEQIKERFNKKYEYEQIASKPSTLSVSEIKKMEDDEEEYIKKHYQKEIIIEKKVPNFIEKSTKKFTAAEKGTLMHLVLELLNFKQYDIEKLNDFQIKDKIIDDLNLFVEKNILTQEEMEIIDIEKIFKFFKSEIYKQIYQADINKKLYKEKAINYNIKLSQVYKECKEYKNAEDEKIMIIGIIDLFFETEDGLVLIDYKTDYIDKKNQENSIENLKKKYKIQLDLYQEAIERNSNKKVIKRGLYLFFINKFILI